MIIFIEDSSRLEESFAPFSYREHTGLASILLMAIFYQMANMANIASHRNNNINQWDVTFILIFKKSKNGLFIGMHRISIIIVYILFSTLIFMIIVICRV